MIENFLFFLLIILVIMMFFVKKYINAILVYAAFGTILSGIFFMFNAPDVAAVQMTIGSAFMIFVYIIAIKTRSKIKVAYVKTPYLFDDSDGDLKGFENELLENFSKNSFFDIEYIPVNKSEIYKIIENEEYDIYVGGIVVMENNNCKCLYSESYLPTKLFEYNDPIDEKYKSIIISNERKNFIDYLRLKALFRKEIDVNVKEVSISGYRMLFNHKNKALRDDFNRFLKNFITSKEYENIVRRNIG